MKDLPLFPYTMPEVQNFNSIPVEERGNRFAINSHGMLFDRLFWITITPPALNPDIVKRAEVELNKSEYNLSKGFPVSLGMNEAGKHIFVSSFDDLKIVID